MSEKDTGKESLDLYKTANLIFSDESDKKVSKRLLSCNQDFSAQSHCVPRRRKRLDREALSEPGAGRQGRGEQMTHEPSI